MSITTKVETITPKQAEHYLGTNTANRPVRKWWVHHLSRIISEGRWRLTHNGIAFNCDGTLLDGQHRLMAIVEAGKPVKMNVTVGLPRDSVFAIDQGVQRTITDVGGSAVGIEQGITQAEAACARAMMNGITPLYHGRRQMVTHEEMITFILRHRDAIAFAIASTPSGAIKVAPVRGVLARAWYAGQVDRLAEFCEAARTQVASNPGDMAAPALAKFINGRPDITHHRVGRIELYGKAECAVRAFLARRPVSKLYQVESEQFPLPEEKD